MSIGSVFQMIGGIVGGPWGMAIAIAGSGIDYAMSDPVQVGKLDDKNMLITSQGQPIQKFWGTARVAGVAIWCSELEEHKESSKGKGGGGKGGKTETYTYRGNLAIAVNDNPVTAYLDIIKDSKDLIYTARKNSTKESLIASNDYADAIRFYYAKPDQRPDSLIQSYEGVSKTPAYRDLSYVVIDGFETKTPYAPSFEFIATTASTREYSHQQIYKENSLNDDGIVIGITNIEVVDLYTYKIYKSHNNILTSKKVDTFGSKENEDYKSNLFFDDQPDSISNNITSISYELKEFYYNRDGRRVTGSISIPRTSKNYQVLYGKFSDDKCYFVYGDKLSQPYNAIQNVLTVNKFNKKAVYFEGIDGKDLFFNGKSINFQIRDLDATENYFYASTYNKIIRFNNVNDIETLYHNTSSQSNVNGEVATVYPLNDNLIYFVEKSGIRAFIKKIEDGVVSTIREVDSVSATANYMFTNNGETFIFVHNTDKYGGGTRNAVFLNTPVYDSSTVFLSDIVMDILKMSKEGQDEFLQDISLEDVDVSDLNGIEVKGFLIKAETSAREALEKLAQCFFFESKVSNGKLIFVRRGKSSIKTIYQDDLSARLGTSGDSEDDFLNIERRHDSDIYNEIRVNHIDSSADFKINSQYVRRQSTNSVNSKTFDLGVAMTPDEARTVATKILDSYWKCRTQYKFKLSLKHSNIEPCDVITLNIFGNIHVVRIIELNCQDGLIDVTAISEDPGIYNQKSVGATIDKTISNEVKIAPTTKFEFLDIPYLRDQDSQVKGAYVASGPFYETNNWKGCSLLKSLDSGVSFGGYKDFNKKATLGETLNKLGNFQQSGLLDNENYVTVKTNGAQDLLSVDFSSMLNGANIALIGNEIIQFMFAEAVDNNTYNLYGLLRGCKGTEYAMSTHNQGERFVLLTTDTIDFIALSSADFDIESIYKAVSFGAYAYKATPLKFNYSGQALECYSPVNVSGGFHSNGATLKWTRRARLNHSWNNYVDVPLDEAQEIYEIDILKNGNVVRTLTSNTATVEYSNSQILEDFTTKPTSIQFRVYQLSSLRGRGNVGIGVIK